MDRRPRNHREPPGGYNRRSFGACSSALRLASARRADVELTGV